MEKVTARKIEGGVALDISGRSFSITDGEARLAITELLAVLVAGSIGLGASGSALGSITEKEGEEGKEGKEGEEVGVPIADPFAIEPEIAPPVAAPDAAPPVAPPVLSGMGPVGEDYMAETRERLREELF
jgi:hypothetical protein